MTLLAVAHRAGNDLAALHAAVDLGADVLEADVHVRSRRLEVRHSKHLRPLPVLWDRGPAGFELQPTWSPQLALERLLDAAAEAADRGRPVPDLMLDLKGPGRVGPRVAQLLAGRAAGGPRVLVCGRWWPGVEAVAALPGVRPVLTARTPPELHRLLRRVRRAPVPHGVSLHRSLLVPAAVAALRDRVEVVMSWGVDDLAALDAVTDLGVNAVISDSADVLREVLARR